MSVPYTTTPSFQKFILFTLATTAFFLPIREFPKLLFVLLFLFSSLYVHVRKNTWRQYDFLDYLLLIWGLSGFIIAYFSPFEHKEWNGAISNLFIPLILLFTRHTDFSQKSILLILISTLVGTVIAATEGIWQLTNHQEMTLMLHSVGHSNHSAIFLCINFAIASAFCLTLARKSPFKFYLALFSLLFIIFSMLYTESRGSAITMFFIGLSSSFFWLKKSKKPFLIAAITVLLLTGSLFYGKAPIIEKTLHQTSNGQLILERQRIWNSSLLIWRHNPVFGIGIKNYGEADENIQRHWLAEENRQFSDDFLPYIHGHSLYFNTLAEQAILGVIIIFSVLLKIALSLKTYYPRLESSDFSWLLWLSTFGSLQVVIINGLVNTTLRVEHGLLFAIITGLWLSFTKYSRPLL
ncbi:hypothetical protein BMR02_10680 [Methylococcaceae bacterium HT1]|nr:hypothetical protein BMR02_10680 [Methylococcaceae bacterium HT1]TXL18292.1 hypothetical protein BMR04_01520 [Methylococcaceae bacterium HT3]